MDDESRIRITCPDCGKSLKVKEDLRGKRIRCPNKDCAERILVPTEGTAEASQPANDATPILTCYFCQKNRADCEELKIPMYGNVEEVHTKELGNYLIFDKLTVVIPRCKKCTALHWNWELSILKGCGVSLLICMVAAVVGWIVGLLVLPADMKDRGINALMFVGGGTFFVVFILANIVWAVTTKLRARNYFKNSKALPKNSGEYPEISAKLSEGWAIGEKPPGAGQSVGGKVISVVLTHATEIKKASKP
jgi:hypothetical protein